MGGDVGTYIPSNEMVGKEITLLQPVFVPGATPTGWIPDGTRGVAVQLPTGTICMNTDGEVSFYSTRPEVVKGGMATVVIPELKDLRVEVPVSHLRFPEYDWDVIWEQVVAEIEAEKNTKESPPSGHS